MHLTCQTDLRRDAVRRHRGSNGLDYVETGDAGAPLLYAYFLGKLPPELREDQPGLQRYLRIDGGDRITGLRILDVDPQVDPDPERDDYLVLRLDRTGDFSSYALTLVDVAGIDPAYASASFRFGIDCPSPVDCKPACDCEPDVPDEPRINYLAKDFASFRQLILDRLALLMPGWTERHVPDLGVTLVELLAYLGDHLSYEQDAVATEAYIGTARQRISMRRHARLVDYAMHEGCNARAWVHVRALGHLELPSDKMAFITGLNLPASLRKPVLPAEALGDVAAGSYEYFEPLPSQPPRTLAFWPALDEIPLYTWGRRECCLLAGATRATLRDAWVAGPAQAGQAAPRTRALAPLQAGDVLVFEEVLGARTGNPADADPSRRWAVRLTKVTPAEDALYPVDWPAGETTQHLPTPVLEIEWAAADALPFALCLSTLGSAPDCAYLADVSVARGNIVLVDHGRLQPPETLPPVPGVTGQACCECEGQPSDVTTRAARYAPRLAQAPLVFCEPWPQPAPPATASLLQDPRDAVPALWLTDAAGHAWTPRADLLASGPDDRDVVAEIDNLGRAHLRFGDGDCGRAPPVGDGFQAIYRTGGGTAGNVGAEAISVLVLRDFSVDGVAVTVRNPLPAQGGIAPEPIEDVRLLAPTAFRRQLERAITAADYAELAQRVPALQRAAAQLAWTGSWYEADVAVDPLGSEDASPALLRQVCELLHRYRRIGHDLHVMKAAYVPIRLALEVCALPGHERGQVLAALLARFGRGVLRGGQRAFFHPDELSFGEAVFLSRIVAAAQAVPGVECVTVTEFHRCFAAPNREIENGLLPLAANEIAQLDNDPDHPERGDLRIVVRGGR
jgi:hypothetical protein